MSTRNPSQLSPQFEPPERGRQTYDVVIGENTRRSGPMQAEERLAADRRIASSTAMGFHDGRQRPQTYESKIADGRGPAGYLPAPAWASVDGAMLASMADGTSASGQQRYQTVIAPRNGGRRPNSADVTTEL